MLDLIAMSLYDMIKKLRSSFDKREIAQDLIKKTESFPIVQKRPRRFRIKKLAQG